MTVSTNRARLLLVGLTLATAFLSFLLLSLPWYRLVMEGRAFSAGGGIFFQSVPFAWPFAVAGFLLPSDDRSFRTAVIWLLILAASGTLLYSTVVRVSFAGAQEATLASYVHAYGRFLMPPLFEGMGFLSAQVLMRLSRKLNAG